MLLQCYKYYLIPVINQVIYGLKEVLPPHGPGQSRLNSGRLFVANVQTMSKLQSKVEKENVSAYSRK